MANTMNRQPNADWFTGEIRTSNVALIADTVTALPATPLTNRREIWIANDTGAVLYVGHSGIWAARGGGWEIATGSYEKFKLDAGVVIYGITAAASNVMILEFA